MIDDRNATRGQGPRWWSRFWRNINHWLGETVQETVDLEQRLIRSLFANHWPTWRQLKQMGYVFTKRERRVVAVSLGVVVVCLIWIGSIVVMTHRDIVPGTGGIYREGIIGSPQFFNPVLGSSNEAEADINRLIFSGLYRYNEKLELVPDLADSTTISADGRHYTVKLKPNLVWHDNTPLSANDVVFTYNSLTNKSIASPFASALQGITISATSDQVIEFTLPKSYHFFSQLLTIGLVPQHLWSTVPVTAWRDHDNNRHPIGSGSWAFESSTLESDGRFRSITLTKSATIRSARLDQLTFTFFSDRTSAIDALRSQAIDGLVLLSGEDRAEVSRVNNISLLPLDTTAVTGLFFNTGQSTSPVSDLRVRQALQAAIDRKALLSTVGDLGEAVTGPFPFPLNVNNKPQTTDNADQILTAAGWPRQGAIRMNKNGETLDIAITVINRQPDVRAAEFIQNSWRKIGVESSLSLISDIDPSTIEQQVIRPRAYEALLFTMAYGAAIDPYPFWHSSARNDPGLNLSRFSDTNADEAIEKIRRASTDDTAKAGLTELSQIIQQQVPAIFLYRPVLLYGVRNSLHGLNLGLMATSADRFNNLNDWYVNTIGSWHW